MHCLLSIAEMLDHIMGFAEKSTLANAAAVHSSWSTICLDKLWYQMDKLTPLLLIILPLYDEPQASGGGGETAPAILPEPNQQAWQRFHAYARRIRELNICPEDKHIDTLRLINRLSHPGDYLFPNLNCLEWSASSSISLEYAIMFIGPSIESLTLGMSIRDIRSPSISNLYSILDVIGSRIPNLQSVKFDIIDPGKEHRRNLQDSVAALLLKCPKLKDVNIQAVWFDMMYFITGCRLWELPALKSINTMDATDNWSQHPTTKVPGSFPALTELSLCANCHVLTKVLLHLSIATERLKSVRIDSEWAELPLESIILVTSIMQSFQSLTEVSFLVGRYLGPRILFSDSAMPFEVFDPLFLCPNITSLSISYHHGIAYSADTFDNVVNRWPLLKVLSAGSKLIKNIRGTPDAHQNPTFATLVLLAGGLRSLEILRLSVDFIANTAPTSAQIPTPPPTPFYMLDCFDVASSHSSNKQETARLLCTVIPPDCRLDYRKDYHRFEPKYPGRDDWAEVQDLMDFMDNQANIKLN